MASGDSCLIRRGPNGELRVLHFDCDEHPDGTLTEFRGDESVIISSS